MWIQKISWNKLHSFYYHVGQESFFIWSIDIVGRFPKYAFKYPDEDIYGLGVSAGEIIPRDTILFWKKTLNFETVLEYIEKIICRYGFLGTYDETNQNEKRIIVIRHRLGKKGSEFLHGYLKATLKTTLNLDSKFDLQNIKLV